MEATQRQLSVSSDEVYEEIKKLALANNMNISQFYDAIRESNGLTSAQLKEKMKIKLLSQKLYGAIAYSHINPPTDAEIQQYYELHKSSFVHPSVFYVTIYGAKSASKLQEKMDNLMFYVPEVQTKDEVIAYDKIAPELASLLTKTPLNTFTQIVPNGQNGFMSFYIKSIESSQARPMESFKDEIANLIMNDKREQVLGDYFQRLRNTADIKILRTN
jgi:hypothetical protein